MVLTCMSDVKFLSTLHKTKKSTISKVIIDKKIYVIKSYNLNEYDKVNYITNEINVLQSLNHPNIITYFSSLYSEPNIHIVIEYCSHGDLTDIIRVRKLTEDVILNKVTIPLLKSLEYIHSKGIIHRDIKPENIFVDSKGNLKLGDFDNSLNINKSYAVDVVGTLEFMSPEMIELSYKTPHEKSIIKEHNISMYNEKVDVWALGILIYELFYTKTPFICNHDNDVKENILNMPIVFANNNDISVEAISFILTTLVRKKVNRPYIKDLFKHSWITGKNNIKSTVTRKTVSFPNLQKFNKEHTTQPHGISDRLHYTSHVTYENVPSKYNSMLELPNKANDSDEKIVPRYKKCFSFVKSKITPQ